jgi:hypothetical protein
MESYCYVNMEVLISGIILKCRRLWWRKIKTLGSIPQDSVSETEFVHHWREYKTHLEVFSALGFGWVWVAVEREANHPLARTPAIYKIIHTVQYYIIICCKFIFRVVACVYTVLCLKNKYTQFLLTRFSHLNFKFKKRRHFKKFSFYTW